MFALHKRDKNEKEIIAALTAIGAVVSKIQGLAGGDFGVPDLLCGHRGRTILLEIKEPASHQKTKKQAGGTEVPENAKGQLTPTQVDWWSKWIGGEAYVVETPEEAVRVVRGAELQPGTRVLTAAGGAIVEVHIPSSNLNPAQADALAGALHEQAGVARALAAAKKEG